MPKAQGSLTEIFRRIVKSPETQLKAFLDDASPDVQMDVRDEMRSKVFFLDFTNILTDTGVVTEQSFVKEFLYRLNRQFFPALYTDQEFRSYLQKMNSQFQLTDIILSISTPTLARFLDWSLKYDEILASRLKKKLDEPLRILTSRLVFYATSRKIYPRLNTVTDLKNSFLKVEKITYSLLDEPKKEAFEELSSELDKCRRACDHIRNNRSTDGISLDVTYKLLTIQDLIVRIRELAELLVNWGDDQKSMKVAYLIQKLLLQEKESRKISALFFQYVELVFYEITEHTGKAGENYIHHDKKGTRKMLKKGLLGGLIVGGLSIAKPLLHELNLAPLFEALGYSLIYSGIFLLIYFVKGVLATKQPAMTASTLAKELDAARPGNEFLWSVSETIQATFRSQFVAIAGNFVVAMPVAAFVYLVLQHTGIYQFPLSSVTYLHKSLHPILSLSFYYAALTGVCLSVSGMLAGGVRNWYVFNQMERRLILNLGKYGEWSKQRVTRMTKVIDAHLEGLAGNISLGFLLGFLSTAGEVIGLPVDIRHITFASAQLGTALAHFGLDFSALQISMLFFSVLMIGVINLGVSFALTFFIVFKSRRLTFYQGGKLIELCMKRFLKSPGDFFFRSPN